MLQDKQRLCKIQALAEYKFTVSIWKGSVQVACSAGLCWICCPWTAHNTRCNVDTRTAAYIGFWWRLSRTDFTMRWEQSYSGNWHNPVHTPALQVQTDGADLLLAVTCRRVCRLWLPPRMLLWRPSLQPCPSHHATKPKSACWLWTFFQHFCLTMFSNNKNMYYWKLWMLSPVDSLIWTVWFSCCFDSLCITTYSSCVIQVPSNRKLPVLYLIDSIVKNLPQSMYPAQFSRNIVKMFCDMFNEVSIIACVMCVFVPFQSRQYVPQTYHFSALRQISSFYDRPEVISEINANPWGEKKIVVGGSAGPRSPSKGVKWNFVSWKFYKISSWQS